MNKILAAICAAGILTTSAVAQNTPAPATVPTMAQCTSGWTSGMQWSKVDFDAACLKVQADGKK